MPRNGAGVYTPYVPGNPVVTGTTISSTTQNNTINDIATALSGSIAADGQTTITASIPMAGFKLTGLAAGSAATDSARVGQVQGSGAQLLNAVAGTNTITATLSPTLTAYAAGQIFTLTPANSNTAATTLNIDGLGAKNIFSGGAACAGGELIAAVPAQIEYDGTQFNILGNAKALTFTPTLTLGGAAVGMTYATQAGRYVKVGSRVFFTIEIVLTALGSSTGNAVINGLPFTATAHNFPCTMYVNIVAAMTPLCGLVVSGSTTIAPYKFGTGTGNATQFTHTDLGNSSQLFFNGFYDV